MDPQRGGRGAEDDPEAVAPALVGGHDLVDSAVVTLIQPHARAGGGPPVEGDRLLRDDAVAVRVQGRV